MCGTSHPGKIAGSAVQAILAILTGCNQQQLAPVLMVAVISVIAAWIYATLQVAEKQMLKIGWCLDDHRNDNPPHHDQSCFGVYHPLQDGCAIAPNVNRLRLGMSTRSVAFRNGMRGAGKLAASTLDYIEAKIQPGITTLMLERYCVEYIEKHGGRSGCHGYKGYPGYVCISPNEVVCHGIPGDRLINVGDIINVDVVVELDGFYGDTARMFCVGEVNPRAQELIEVTRKARDAGIAAVRAGATTGDIGHAIESYVSKTSFKIIKEYCGHGIGRKMHMPPLVRNYGQPGEGIKLEEGMCITIEPIISAGAPQVKELDDGWTVVTHDRRRSAQFEHTIVVTDTGCEILTLRSDDTIERIVTAE